MVVTVHQITLPFLSRLISQDVAKSLQFLDHDISCNPFSGVDWPTIPNGNPIQSAIFRSSPDKQTDR